MTLTGRTSKDWVEILEFSGGIPWLRYCYKTVIARNIFEPTKAVIYSAPGEPLVDILDNWRVPV